MTRSGSDIGRHAPVAIRLATRRDAADIANLSRKAIERGLPWTWTRPRVLRAILDGRTNVVVASDGDAVVGFGVMRYGDEVANLLLFAIDATHRRKGLGSRLLGWLEKVAQDAGLARIGVEARAENALALAFYRRHGYRERREVPGMYFGVEDGVCLVKELPAGGDHGGRAGPR